MSFLVKSEVVGLYLDPFSADARYYRFNAANLPKPIQMHLS